MGVVDDGDDEFAFVVKLAHGGDEAGFAFMIIAVGFQFEGFAEQAQHGVPGVEAAVDHGGDPFFLVVMEDGVFQNGFPGAGFAEQDAEASLLAVDFEDVEVALLLDEQRGLRIGGERVFFDAEMGSYHGD